MWMLGEFPKNKFANFPEKFKVGIKKKRRCSEAYSEPSQRSKIELSAVNYFPNKSHLMFD